METVNRFIDENRARFVSQLCDWLRIPSISADSRHKADVARAAEFVASDLEASGLKTEILPTPGHPVVYAEWLGAPGQPTILVYGHYDVQPPDPLDQWVSGPFEPTERNGNLFARGATDDKGQVFTHVKSVEAWMKSEQRLPINVKFLIEGEEEVGSANLEHFVRSNKERLRCDYVVISDCSQFAPGVPAITYGLKGLTYFEVFLSGPKQDLHSGMFGGAVANPANNLASIIAALHDAQRRVQLPGFYDDVIPLADWERKQFAELPFDENGFKDFVGLKELVGETGYTTVERKWARPTCDVNGVTAGYQGEGAKTIIPARASAKISFRLVPNQDPHKVAASLRQFVQSRLLPGVRCEIKEYGLSPAALVAVESPGVQAAARAIEIGFGKKPVFVREGGSIPVVGTFKRELGVDTLLLGWGQNDDNLHSPNEKFSLADFHRGIRASACLWEELSKSRKQP
jgi:acetylornithine deacetylase/succinyl-diaminopimelate desuccinylase-like protein